MKMKDYILSMFSAGLLCLVALSGTANAACKDTFRVVAVGDSLVAGYGLDTADSFTVRLQEKLAEKGMAVTIANAGVSGDTTTGGLARLDWSVPDGTDLVILELGANDAMRGIPVDKTRENLEAMVDRLSSRNIPILLAGMMAPPNMGPVYGDAFNAIYPELSANREIALYPFFLDGVAAEPSLNLSDGIHPNPQGIDIIVERMAPVVASKISAICSN